ncbi:MAG: aminotransferase class III-fold pyridoxal phosphate-dependent enzyme, partial [Alphaproteobacteria bacterium]|nr:aminotransferase class III-fold pyridoxal phosphate-dependent enzyme [Alphaproteobacteria bacterium]
SDQDPHSFGLHAASMLEKKILDLGPENVAAFIGEPIQGAGGVIIPPDSYWPEIQRICKKYDLLLVADEVVTGFGRTGEWFASSQYGIEPDLMTLAKGLTSGYMPLSAAVISDKIADVILAEGVELQHGYTYSGHPVSCAVALENIKILKKENLIMKVKQETSPYLWQRLQELKTHPLVGEVRLKGFMGAIELVKDKNKREFFEPLGKVGTICRDHCFRLGLIMRATRDTMMMSPSLIWTKDIIDEFMVLAKKALDYTWEDVQRL